MDKHILITGGSSGLGPVLAEVLVYNEQRLEVYWIHPEYPKHLAVGFT